MKTYLIHRITMRHYFSLFVMLSAIFLFSCKKITLDETNNATQTQPATNNTLIERSASEIRDWLDDKKSEIGVDSNATIDKLLYSMDDGGAYTETFKGEQFIIIPLDDTGSLSRNIRTDLNAPLKFLLMVEDENGNLRKGNIALFYPSSAWTISLPQDFFTNFFENQVTSIDGTFALLSLNDVKQYEMDFENGIPKEFRLWQGRLQPAQPTEPVCYDHYLTTIIYYSDGTTDVFEEYLYTVCSDPTGGGGGGSSTPPPNTNNQQFRQVIRNFIVRSRSTSYEGWTMTAFYQLSGTDFPNNPALNTFNTAPTNITGTNSNSSAMTYRVGTMHTVSTDPWYITFSLANNTVGLLNNNRNAYANFTGCLTFPNQLNNLGQPKFECFNKPWNWQASIVLH